MTRPPLDPARGAEAARKLKSLGVKGILVRAAELGYITQVTCRMPECFCPEELGGARYFEPLTELTDWMPTHEHFPLAKRDGGHRSVDNSVLAHRLCNRIDYSDILWEAIRERSERVKKLARRPPGANASRTPSQRHRPGYHPGLELNEESEEIPGLRKRGHTPEEFSCRIAGSRAHPPPDSSGRESCPSFPSRTLCATFPRTCVEAANWCIVD